MYIPQKKRLLSHLNRTLEAIIIAGILFMNNAAYPGQDKEADLAGSWYPASGPVLARQLQGYLDSAVPENIDGRIFAVISPHAGYGYSGPVAAYGFKSVKDRGVKTVVIVGFSHRQSFDGISIFDKGSFGTPLGAVRVDEKLAAEIKRQSERIRAFPQAFDGENSVEMQIPFVQASLGGVSIVPIAFGTQSFDDASALADALANALKGRDDCLVVASTDMSHYHTYEEARSIDKHTISVIQRMAGKELYEEARMQICELCGMMPVTAVLLAAEKLGYKDVKVLKYANSGDTAGDKNRVVGYMSAVIYKSGVPADTVKEKEGETRMLNDTQRKRLLRIARESITAYVKDGKRAAFVEPDPGLNSPMGVFVTLHESGQLRGCIGNMAGHGPLYQTVADMAIEAATGDPRFPALRADEIVKVDLEISVLSPMKKVQSHAEITIPGHGVMIRKGYRSGVYLPQVATETGWGKEEFLTSLCAHKAGLGPNAWKDKDTELYVFSAEVFQEKGE